MQRKPRPIPPPPAPGPRYPRHLMDALARLLHQLTEDPRTIEEKAADVRAAMEERLADIALEEFISYLDIIPEA